MTKAVLLARSVSNTGLLLDGDLTAIAQLSGTSGLLQKTSANTWQLDTTTYLPLTGGTVSGALLLSNTTASTSTTTGALIVGGGMGVAGNIYANNIYSNNKQLATTGKAIAMAMVFGG